jgi:hypothetical protein
MMKEEIQKIDSRKLEKFCTNFNFSLLHNRHCHTCSLFRFSLVDRVNDALQQLTGDMDEEEILRRTSGGRIRIGLTDSGYFPNFRSNQRNAYVFVDEFQSLQEILAGCILSSYLPGLTGPAPWKRSDQSNTAVFQANKILEPMIARGSLKDRKGNRRDTLFRETSELWDGGLVNLFPTIDSQSLLVTPFAGKFNNPTITPTMMASTTESSTAFSIPKMALVVNRYSSLDVSMENLRTLRYMALSSTDDALQAWFSQGYDSCQSFLSKEDMLTKFSVSVPRNHQRNNMAVSSQVDKRSFHSIPAQGSSTTEQPSNNYFLRTRRKSNTHRDFNSTGARSKSYYSTTNRRPIPHCKYLFIVMTMMLWCVPSTALDEVDTSSGYDDNSLHNRASHLSSDPFEDSFLDPLSIDPSCINGDRKDCYSPPKSTIEEETVEVTTVKWDATCFKGDGNGLHEEEETGIESFESAIEKPPDQCIPTPKGETKTIRVDKHWGRDQDVLLMRDLLINRSRDTLNDSRPPIFLLPGLASTRLGE